MRGIIETEHTGPLEGTVLTMVVTSMRVTHELVAFSLTYITELIGARTFKIVETLFGSPGQDIVVAKIVG